MERHPYRVLAALLLCASLVRVVYFVQMQQTVLLQLHRVDQTDMHYYDGWARQIAAGDWLSRSLTVPMHPWHRLVAQAYFDQNPAERASFGATAPDDPAAASRLWSQWLGVPRFYQDPLHPYLMAVTYRLAGADVRYVFAWQLALGVVGIGLLWSMSRRFFGDAAAAITGALAVLAVPLLYYEMMLLKESLIGFAGLLLVWLTDRAFTSGRWPAFLTLGLALGLSTLLKSTFGLFIVCTAAAIVMSYRRDRRQLASAGAALVLGMAIGFGPLVARNVAVGAPPLSLGSTGPLTFAATNQLDFPVDAGWYMDVARLAVVMGRHDGRGAGMILDTLREHTPWTAARMVWQKFDRTWHWYEIPNNEDFYYVRLWVPVLQWLPVTFWVVAPFAWLGLAVAVRTRQRTWPLLVLAACSTAPLLIFYVLGRFRVPLFAALLPLAAVGLVQIGTWAKARAYRQLALASAVVIGLAVWTGRPVPSGNPLIRPSDWVLPMLIAYERDVREAAQAGDSTRAADAYLEYFKYAPSDEQLLASGSPDLVRMFGQMRAECARMLRHAGRIEEAEVQERRAAPLLRLSKAGRR